MAATALDYFAIKNTLARYCIALDNKDFDLLSQVFTPDVDAKYPFPGGDMKGVEAVAAAIKKRLTPVVTQHALTTQTIEVNADGDSASATTYFTGVHLGQGRWKGQQVTAYGKYVDELVLIADSAESETVKGARGQWRVCRREVLFMGRVGEEGVMTGE